MHIERILSLYAYSTQFRTNRSIHLHFFFTLVKSQPIRSTNLFHFHLTTYPFSITFSLITYPKTILQSHKKQTETTDHACPTISHNQRAFATMTHPRVQIRMQIHIRNNTCTHMHLDGCRWMHSAVADWPNCHRTAKLPRSLNNDRALVCALLGDAYPDVQWS